MKQHKTECYCECHFGSKIRHWQLVSGEGYQRSACSCEIEGNPNFVPEEIRKDWS